MAKNEPNKPDDKKSVPADKKQAEAKASPDKPLEAEKAPDNVVPFDKSKQAAQEAPVKKAEEPVKTEESTKSDDGLRKVQEDLLKALDEKAADIKGKPKKQAPAKVPKAEKSTTPDKKQREARPPKGPKETPPPPEPEKPPEPKEAPRPGEKEEIVFLKLSELFPFKDHPFQVRDDDEMRAMAESVKDKGVTNPAVVRPREGGGYELVSGHRRQKASELAGFTDMPCIVRNLTDEQAITQMVEDNTTQRENILPSEKAKALKMQLDAIKRQGVRDGGNGQRSDEIVAKRNKMTGKQVQRYIKLNDLVPELMKMTDEGKLKFTPALELAFVSRKNQQYIALAIDAQQSSPNLSQAQRLRKLDQDKLLNPDVIDGIMLEEKKEVDKVILNSQELSKYFGPEKTPSEMKEEIIKALDEKFGQKEMAKPEKKAEQEK